MLLLPHIEIGSYTEMRKNREEFRKKLISLIMSTEADIHLDQTEFPNSEEKELLRYYYFIKHGIDTIHVAPMNAKVLKKYGVRVTKKIIPI